MAGNTWARDPRGSELEGNPPLMVRVYWGPLEVTGCQKSSEQVLGHQ